MAKRYFSREEQAHSAGTLGLREALVSSLVGFVSGEKSGCPLIIRFALVPFISQSIAILGEHFISPLRTTNTCERFSARMLVNRVSPKNCPKSIRLIILSVKFHFFHKISQCLIKELHANK